MSGPIYVTADQADVGDRVQWLAAGCANGQEPNYDQVVALSPDGRLIVISHGRRLLIDRSFVLAVARGVTQPVIQGPILEGPKG